MTPYPKAVRDAITLKAYISQSIPKLSRYFKIHQTTIRMWLRVYRSHGEVRDKPRKGRPMKLTRF